MENCYIAIWILFNWPKLQVFLLFSIHECVKGCKYFHILSILTRVCHEGFFFYVCIKVVVSSSIETLKLRDLIFHYFFMTSHMTALGAKSYLNHSYF